MELALDLIHQRPTDEAEEKLWKSHLLLAIEDTITSMPNLQSLEIDYVTLDLYLSLNLLLAISQHSSLEAVKITSLTQLVHIPTDTISRSPELLNRICCRELKLYFSGAKRDVPKEFFEGLFCAGRGVRLEVLHLSGHIPRHLQTIYFHGLQSVTILCSPRMQFPDLQGIALPARHPSLTNITVKPRSFTFPPFQTLACLPCIDDLYAAAVKEGLGGSLWLNEELQLVKVLPRTDGPSHAFDALRVSSSWGIAKATLILIKDGVRPLSLFMKFACPLRYITVEANFDDEGNPTMPEVFAALSAYPQNLQNLQQIKLVLFPLWESEADHYGPAASVCFHADNFRYTPHGLGFEVYRSALREHAWWIIQERLGFYVEYHTPLIEELGKLCPSLERVIIYCSNERDGTSAHFEYTFKVDKNGAPNGDRVFGAVVA
ncbi:uncharacterized protein STEHIDRAFT_107441 [Stereum hirsutum FP-91666 SS1]|uniref:uncharacterized protein n=1 Tax=Stereum hirsutum (strain FP-91666) TaxID=721885 RepID=UPI000440B150|nr:uncharacterized protein STEHIDRAFT_107441 [Stereum hirsutum FP-91666 SS1]EIM90683.1 hypothetical protein STEHIDRAFT_107441 [Stereum hirsutum FP-91666 SS1]